MLPRRYARPRHVAPCFFRVSSSSSPAASSAPSARLVRRKFGPSEMEILRGRVRSMVAVPFSDPRTISMIVNQVGRAQLLGDLEKLDTWFDNSVVRGMMKPDSYVYSALVDAYSRNGDFGRAEALLEKQRSFKLHTVHSYTAIMTSYLSRGYLARAENLLKQMKTQGVIPTVITYHALLSYFAERGMVDRVDSILKEMSEHGLRPDEITLGQLMMTFSKAGNHALVERLTTLLPAPGSTAAQSASTIAALWQARIHAALKQSDAKGAFTLAEESRKQGASLAPNTLGHLINALGRASQLDLMGKVLVWVLQSPRLPLLVTFTSAIAAYAREAQAEKGLALLHSLKKAGIPLESDAFNPLLFDFATRGAIDKLEKLLQELYASNVPFSDVTYRMLLKIFLLTHDNTRAKAILKEIQTKNISIHQTFLSAALKQLANAEWSP